MKENPKACVFEKTIEEENYCKLTWMPCKEVEDCPEEVETYDNKRSNS